MLRILRSHWWVFVRVPRRLGLSLPHNMTWMDERLVVHIRGGEGFACEVSNPITELVVTSCDEAALVTTKGMKDRKFSVTEIAVRGEVWGIYAVA